MLGTKQGSRTLLSTRNGVFEVEGQCGRLISNSTMSALSSQYCTKYCFGLFLSKQQQEVEITYAKNYLGRKRNSACLKKEFYITGLKQRLKTLSYTVVGPRNAFLNQEEE
ncbi:Hypothetical_protein [Hexamita inflata]|uniref:Hypothetical_protein n=1 Tax=Hexamita inflata TaxID=28002 RepID=A0AA86UA51_9EUKA|nr:Hypothetical protein HINF_LOCUS31007 [Hexamita inflata]